MHHGTSEQVLEMIGAWFILNRDLWKSKLRSARQIWRGSADKAYLQMLASHGERTGGRKEKKPWMNTVISQQKSRLFQH